ncbi:hypothetical protein HDU77_000166 [Chytriomyces hyalinus]|nr:hypothetical protein HDU77_000166 [Chytriomyces hyalinus]
MKASPKPTPKGSIASLSIAPDYDLAQSNHSGPKQSYSASGESHADLKIPNNRASAQNLLRALENATSAGGAGAGFDLGAKRVLHSPSRSMTSLHPRDHPRDVLPPQIPSSPMMPAAPKIHLEQPPLVPPSPSFLPQTFNQSFELEEKIRQLELKNKSLLDETKFLHERNDTLQLEIQAKNTTMNILKRDGDFLVGRLQREKDELTYKIEMDEQEADRYVKATPEEWSQLNQKIEVLIRENDILVEENKTRSKGIEQLQEIISSQAEEVSHLRQTESSLTSQIASREEKIRHVEAQLSSATSKINSLLSTLSTSNAESTRLEQELAHALEMVQTEKGRCESVREALDAVTDRYREHVSETEHLAVREKQLISILKSLEAENEGLAGEVSELKSECQTVTDNLESMISLSKTLESKIQDAQISEMDAAQRLQLAVQRSEEAFLERDKALLREQQSLEEIKRLNEKYAETAQKYKLKAENEVASLRSQHLQDRRKLGEDISKLEASVAHAQAQTDRAIREKRAAESELEKMSHHIPDEVERLNGIIEEVAARLRSAEREKAENMETLSSLQQKLSRDQNRHEKEKEELVFQVDDFYRRLRRAEKDLEDAKENTVKIMSQVSTLEHDNEKLRDSKIKYQMNKEGEFQSLLLKHENETSDLKSRLSAVSASHSKTCQELQHLIATQHDLSTRWKSESASLVSRYESVVSDLRAQLTRYQEKMKEMEVEIGDVAQLRKEAVLEVEAEQRNTQKAKLLLRAAEDKCDSLGRRIEALMKNEHDVLSEKKHLQRQLDRMHMERERLERERSYKENRESGQVRYATKMALQERVTPSDTDSQQDVRALQAEIERVKSRSRAAHHNSHVGAFINGLDDEGDESDG